jgi:hypothetical protein
MCKFKSSRFVFLVQARALASHAFSDVFRLLLLHLSWRLFISISLIAHSRPQILEQTTMKSIEELWFDDHFSEPSLHYVQTIGRFLIPYFDMLIRDAVAEVDPGTVLAYLFEIHIRTSFSFSLGPLIAHTHHMYPSYSDLLLWLARCLIQVFALWDVEPDQNRRYTRHDIVPFCSAMFSMLSNYAATNDRMAPVRSIFENILSALNLY